MTETPGPDYDGIDVAAGGGVTYGGSLQFAFGGSAVPEGTYEFLNFSGSSTGSLAAVESSGFYQGTWTPVGSGVYQLTKDAQTLAFSQSTGDVIVVPEPSTVTLALVGFAAAALMVRRRR
jgi:uncharacterized protein (TIGR03382 family)